MDKSKSIIKSTTGSAKNNEMSLTTKVADGSPYRLDPAQVERAATALVTHMKQHAQSQNEASGKKSLVADEDEAEDNDDPIFLNVSTKQHVKNKSRLKPTKVSLPHPVIGNDVRVCVFTKDPQRAYKDVVASDAFPTALRSKIGRVIGVDKLKKKWKSFEQKRQLLAEYDIFLVDDRVIETIVPLLGKTFYASKSKRPIPVRLTAGAHTEKNEKGKKRTDHIVGTPQGIAKEIESALAATYVSMSASANTSIKVGKLSMTPQQLKENIEAVVDNVVNKHIEHKWRNIRGLYIKGPVTKALPIWLSEELWVDEAQVLEQAPQAAIKGSKRNGEKKRKWEEWEEEMLDDEDLEELKAARKSRKSKARKEPKKEETKTISKEKRSKLKRDALQSVQTPLLAG